MTVLTALGEALGATGGAALAKPIDAVGNALNKLFTSDDERLSHAEIMERLLQQPNTEQVELNKIEAASTNWWNSGWRPAIGWVGAAALANVYLINPWLEWITGHPGPAFDVSQLMVLVANMLGFGYIRTLEKKSGLIK